MVLTGSMLRIAVAVILLFLVIYEKALKKAVMGDSVAPHVTYV